MRASGAWWARMSANRTSRLSSVTGRCCSSSNRASSQAVKGRRAHDTFEARAGAEPVQRRDLRRGPRSACPGAIGLVSTSAVAVVAPRRTSVVCVEVVGMMLGAVHRVFTPRRCFTSFGDEHRFDRPGVRVALAACRAPDTLDITPARPARPVSLPDTRHIVDELTSREVELSLGGWLSPKSALGRSPGRDPLPSPRPMDRCEHRHAGAGGTGHDQPRLPGAITGLCATWDTAVRCAFASGVATKYRLGRTTRRSHKEDPHRRPIRRSVASARGDDEPALAIASVPDRHFGAMPQAGIRAHSGTVQRLVRPVDLARFDATVKVPTEGSGRTSRPQAAAILCARYATIRACTSHEMLRWRSAGAPALSASLRAPWSRRSRTPRIEIFGRDIRIGASGRRTKLLACLGFTSV